MPRLIPVPLLAALGLACATPRVTAPPAEEPVPRLRLPADVSPTHAALLLRLDPEADGFSGEVDYDLDLAAPRARLWLNGRDLEVTEAWLEAGGQRVAARYREVDPVGVAEVVPARPLDPGRIRLHLAWRARWAPGLAGLYRIEAGGRRYLATQFENTDARRAFPGFDEPGAKHPWDVTLEVPHGLAVAGNTPVARESEVEGRRRLVLATTRPLPAYLLAVAVGPFDVVEAPAPPNAVRATPLPVRGLAEAGRGADLALALRDGNALLAVLERWFGTPIGTPKLDHVALSQFAAGAMENDGLITYRAVILLRNEAQSSAGQRLWTWSIMAHEMAHQWFGNLVTMPWWDDTWLNESFASWMATEALAEWRPELGGRRLRLPATAAVMDADGLASARAVRQRLEEIERASDQFDGGSYSKGEAVLAMFERWLGPERFRAGVRRYLAEHAGRSGDAEALFEALSAASGREVGPAFHGFLDQPGVPLVTARTRCEGGAARLELAQRRWLPLGSRASPEARWRIPFCARWRTGGELREGCTLLEGAAGALPLGPGCPAWVLPNAGGTGYWRGGQPPEEAAALLAAGWPELTPEERLATAIGAVATIRAGALPLAEALPLLERLARDPDGLVAQAPLSIAPELVERVAGPAHRAAARRWGAALYRPTLERLGLEPRPGEPATDALLRGAAVRFAAVICRDPALRARLAKLGRAWLAPDGPALRPDALPPDLVGSASVVAVDDGGAELFEVAWRRLEAGPDEVSRSRLLGALAWTTDPALAARARTLDERPDQPLAELLLVDQYQLMRPEGEEAAWDHLRRRAEAAAARDPEVLRFLPAAAAGFCDARHLAEVKDFFGPLAARHRAMVLPLAEAVESIELCIASAAAQRGPFEAALDARPGP